MVCQCCGDARDVGLRYASNAICPIAPILARAAFFNDACQYGFLKFIKIKTGLGGFFAALCFKCFTIIVIVATALTNARAFGFGLLFG